MENSNCEDCTLCGLPTRKILSSKLRRGQGLVFFCERCKHGFLVPEKDFNEKAYYADGYRQEYSHNAKPSKTNAREIFDTYYPYQRDRLAIISKYLKSNLSLLEVGASSGQFLSNIKNHVALVNAIELDRECCSFMQEILGIDSDFEDLSHSKFANKTYDLVCAFQVMEHVVSPAQFLKDLIKSTKKGGTIFIEVPNLDDPLLSVWNIRSYQNFFYHSAHLHYFTGASLKKVAIDAGFLLKNIQIEYTQDYNLLNHLNWLTNGVPQETCHEGLSEINFNGKNADIAKWLTQRITDLNKEYISKLVAEKSTSNMMMILKNE
jgi:2-polyprenyl-3-methyl-5-hydroxy-6-metoxy-1,4-benzoquinol methylase